MRAPGAAPDGGLGSPAIVESPAHEPGTAELDVPGVLRDLPTELWTQVTALLRLALSTMPRAELPPAVRPYAGWRPEALDGRRPRAAIADAIAGDARLLAAMGRALADAPASPGPAAELVRARRWTDLLVLSQSVSDDAAARSRAAAQAKSRRDGGAGDAARQKLSRDLRAARSERDEARQRLEAAELRAAAANAAQERSAAEVAVLRERVAALEEAIATERRQHAERLARARRRLEAAGRGRIDTARTADIVERLQDVTDELRSALGVGGRAQPEPEAGQAGPGTAGSGGTGPGSAGTGGGGPSRAASAPLVARPGRPSTLPPGLLPGSTDGVLALLRAPGMRVILDGYNVSRDHRGRPHTDLPQQRAWLRRLVEATCARFGCRALLIFDGTDPVPGAAPSSRSVRTLFSSGEETADDRIVALLEDDAIPALVVTSDRELASRCEALGADVVPSHAFLRTVGG